MPPRSPSGSATSPTSSARSVPDELVEVAARRFEVAANWKLYVENHIDVYHLWYLHERSLAAYDHRRHRWDDCAPHWSFYEPPRDRRDGRRVRAVRLPADQPHRSR